jgi:hypothetical protein
VKFCKPGDPCFPTHAHHLQPTHAFNLYFSFLFFRVEILIVCKKIKKNKKYTRFVLVNSNISAVNCGIKKHQNHLQHCDNIRFQVLYLLAKDHQFESYKS